MGLFRTGRRNCAMGCDFVRFPARWVICKWVYEHGGQPRWGGRGRDGQRAAFGYSIVKERPCIYAGERAGIVRLRLLSCQEKNAASVWFWSRGERSEMALSVRRRRGGRRDHSFIVRGRDWERYCCWM